MSVGRSQTIHKEAKYCIAIQPSAMTENAGGIWGGGSGVCIWKETVHFYSPNLIRFPVALCTQTGAFPGQACIWVRLITRGRQTQPSCPSVLFIAVVHSRCSLSQGKAQGMSADGSCRELVAMDASQVFSKIRMTTYFGKLQLVTGSLVQGRSIASGQWWNHPTVIGPHNRTCKPPDMP